jgi:predicted nucleic acid-binding protein
MRVVLDSSMALTWCLPGQINEQSEGILNYVKSEGALVPPIWHLEMANLLGLKFRDRNLSGPALDSAIRLLRSLDIATDSQYKERTVSHYLMEVLRFELAAYDALYVELALRTGLPLATFDKAMIASARRFSVAMMDVA